MVANRAHSRRTTTLPNGTRVVRAANDNVPEWRLQSAAVRALRSMRGYGDEWRDGVTFTIAGDFNAARRSPGEATKAKATGLAAGEEDLRVYAEGGRLLLIEMKGAKTPVSPEQKKRHALHRGLGFQVEVVRVATEADAAEQVCAVVRRWLAAGTCHP